MREDLIYDQEQQRKYDRQVHREKVAWEIDKRGVFRLPRDERIKLGNTGMQKRSIIPRHPTTAKRIHKEGTSTNDNEIVPVNVLLTHTYDIQQRV